MAVNKLCFYVLLFILYYNNAQYQPLPIRTATLTTSTTSQNGANVVILDSNVVTTNNNNWLIKIPSWMSNGNGDQTGFDMSINLDSNWGFHASKESTIEFTINSDQSTGGSDKDLILSFSVGDSKYFSIFLTLDNNYGNAIYPGCGSGLASGNIKAIVDDIYDNRDREIKAFGGQGLDNSRLQPQSNNYWPTTFTIRNNPSANRVYIQLDNQYIQAQTCEYSTSFPANQGLQIYIASDEINDATIYLKQFQIDYSFQLTYPPSMKPTRSPTKNPTEAATLLPTKSPTKMPSDTPTNNPTKSPSTNPTKTPTITTMTPSIQPTISPTNIPTKTPTKTPSYTPTITPTKNPSISPTKTPTNIPTYSPLKPTFSPTPRPVIVIGGNTPSSTQEHAGSIDEGQVSTQDGDINNDKLNAENNNTSIMYYILAVVSFGLCLCCILAGIFVQKKKRKHAQYKIDKIQKHQQHTTLGTSNNTYNKKKYGEALRLASLSPSSANNQFVIATDISISNKNTTQMHFEHNLTSAVGVNNMLMDDIVNEMHDNNDVIDIIMTPKGSTKGGSTPRLPPPPRRVKSNEDINSIQMSSIMTPNGVNVDTGSDEDDTEGTDDNTGTDDLGTNESVMDKTFTNQNDEKDDDDYLHVMDNIVMTPENFGDHKRTMGGDSDMDEYNEHGNPNVRYDEFVIGSEGGINNNHLTKQ